MNDFESESETWDYLIDTGLVSEDALRLLTDINGYSIDTMNDALYAVSGYRDLKQYIESEES